MLDTKQIQFIRQKGPKGTVRILARVVLEGAFEYDPLHEAKRGVIPTDELIQQRMIYGMWNAVYGVIIQFVATLPPQLGFLKRDLLNLLQPDLSNLQPIKDFVPNGSQPPTEKPNETKL